MATFRCKMCGGALSVEEGASVAECPYCGTQQTLPRLSDERRKNLYERANHLRRNNEFDRARELYEEILNEDRTDAEAYWSIILCKYGVEYVEDPGSGGRVPTVNRMQFLSIFSDRDYRAALEYADAAQRAVYEREAERIDEIQRGYLAVAQNESPFDVFLCYKERDEKGERTPDSVLATELYYELTEAGFRVFFARITLEGKLGTAYEPYIFAALHSAKVMVVLGTRAEYFQAPWVRNEWSRFLGLIQNGEKKVLIPAYRDMDPYHLPEEFSHLQAQDMSKLGFMQDLVHGIRKILGGREEVAQGQDEDNLSLAERIPPLLRRAEIFLEEGDFAQAEEFCERVLNLDPENARAYLGKLMAKLRVRRQEGLKELAEPFDGEPDYRRALRFGDEELTEQLRDANRSIVERNETRRKEEIYRRACKLENGTTSRDCRNAAQLFEGIAPYQDSQKRAERNREREQKLLLEENYQNAVLWSRGEAVSSLERAISQLRELGDYRDSAELLSACERKLEEQRSLQEIRQAAKRRNDERCRRQEMVLCHLKWAVPALILILIGVFWGVSISNQKAQEKSALYSEAVACYEQGNYYIAMRNFEQLGDYLDSASYLAQIPLRECWTGGAWLEFGRYPQGKNGAVKPIEWKVLSVEPEEKRMLLVSDDSLEALPYYEMETDAGWADSIPRTFLNGSFVETAFSEEERLYLTETEIKSENRGETVLTNDRVFLLSEEEIQKFDEQLGYMRTEPSPYIEDRLEAGYHYWWWLRSDGMAKNYAKCINDANGVEEELVIQTMGVRPAIWLCWG